MPRPQRALPGRSQGRVAESLAEGAALLVLGGDCTVELGTVAGASVDTEDLGLIYIDLDTDLNTPESVEDGALDWMGVAHLLGVDGTVPDLPRNPRRARPADTDAAPGPGAPVRR